MNSLVNVWRGMIHRCTCPSSRQYHRYGGRGITVCDRWLHSFDAFCEDTGERPEGTSIDRIDNDGNYEPSNCKWSTPKEQSRNRSDNRIIEFRGKRQTLPDWADEIGLTRTALKRRLEHGWSKERALTTPRDTKYNPIRKQGGQ